MKNRFFLITLAILSMGLFVTSNLRAQDGPGRTPRSNLSPGTTTGTATDDGGAHQRDSWERYNHAR